MAEKDQLDKVLEHLDKIHAGIDDMNDKHTKLAGRLDALEQEREKQKTDAKARADAEAKEKETKAIADAALRRKDSDDDDLAKNREAFADAQMRADSAYQALGSKQAPHALAGETLSDFRVRLMKQLQPHSAIYKGSDLGILVQDASSFRLVEDAIINDAMQASMAPPPAGAPLREQVTRTDEGHIIRKFIGDPGVVWGPFMGGATKFGRINRDMANRR